MGSQDCCHDPRFTVVGTTVHDATTGRVWWRYGGSGFGGIALAVASCAASIPGGRLPTTAELEAIEIGTPDIINGKMYSVCDPIVDQTAFKSIYDGETYTSDGCVDMLRGISKPYCTVGKQIGILCIVP